ncbi:MAG TPA: PPC domain-containing protein [Polyangia bacterium]|jgi:hypothetical protein
MRKSNWIAFLAVIALGAFGAGCGGGGTTVECTTHVPCPGANEQCVNGKCVVVVQDDAGTHQDDAGHQQQDGPVATCDKTGYTPAGASLYVGSSLVQFDAWDSANDPYNGLSIEFWNPLAAGAIELGGSAAEENYKSCSTCVMIYQGCTAGATCNTNSATKIFMAMSGTLTVTADGATPGTHFTATLANAQFKEVTIASDFTSTLVAGGQLWCVNSQALDAMNGCNTTADCSSGVCDVPSNTCVECLATGDCASSTNGHVCDTTTKSCVECLTNTDCASSANGHFCDTRANACVECMKDADCSGNTHGTFCSSGNTCGPCKNDFQCTLATAPSCLPDPADDTRLKCGVSASTCTTGDDTTESANNGPAGAVDASGGTAVAGKACEDYNANAADPDYFKFTTTGTSDVTVHLAWTATGADLDLQVYDAQGHMLGLSWYGTSAEDVALTYLAAGTYYAQVTAYARSTATTPTIIPYTITVTGASSSCTADTQCSAVYEHQLLRGKCNTTSHACEFINGAGALAAGAACDSLDDCASGLCTYGAFMSDGFTYAYQFSYFKDAATRSFCVASQCQADTDCTAPQVCSMGFCLPKCTEDAQCPVDMGGTSVSATGAWAHVTCTVATGVCTPQ